MKRVRIFIIDDQEEHAKDIERKIIDSSISQAISIFRASYVDEAKEFFEKGGGDIVVLDLNLPIGRDEPARDGEGRKLIKYIKDVSPFARIILITGETRERFQDLYLNEDFSKGIDDYILKDSNNDYIQQIVKRISELVPIIQESSDYTKTEDLHRIVIFENNLENRERLNRRIKAEFEIHDKKKGEGYLILEMNSLNEALKESESSIIDVIIVNVDKKDAIRFIDLFLKHRQDIPILAVSFKGGTEGFENLKNAHKHGAKASARIFEEGEGDKCVDGFRYKAKDFFITALKEVLKSRKDIFEPFSSLIGNHPILTKAFAMANVASQNDAPVIIWGESGTGKDLLAKAIHTLYIKKRQSVNFVAINCAAIPDTLLESELFGSKSGAFTDARDKKGLFEIANNGTLFLDEVSEMPLGLQVKLLRVLEDGTFRALGDYSEKKVNTKIIAATNRNLKQAVQEGRFRNDLYQRLNVFSIYLPPLRQRKSDIPILVHYFIKQYAQKYYKSVLSISKDALNFILSLDFEKGNVRELKNIIERLIAHLPPGREQIELADIKGGLEGQYEDALSGYSITIPHWDFTLKEVALWSKWMAIITILRNNPIPDREDIIKKMEISESAYYDILHHGKDLAIKTYTTWEGFCNAFNISGLLRNYLEHLHSQ